jgi:hypothetical protein
LSGSILTPFLVRLDFKPKKVLSCSIRDLLITAKIDPDKKWGLFTQFSSEPDGGPDKGLKSRLEIPVLSGPFYPVPYVLCIDQHLKGK